LGFLVHGDGKRFEFDDRVLAHVQVAVGTKLRRRESFFLSWELDADQGSGRTSLWVSGSTPLQFLYRHTPSAVMNMAWLEAMVSSSHGPQGLVISAEDAVESSG
jgi:hypothetical protein